MRKKNNGAPKKNEIPSIVIHPHPNSIEKCGWLHKWTNYIKGYRQRWFVLDDEGNLSYYRGPNEVGLSCRGSINLQEAKIHSDVASSQLIISASSQSFHLKASSESDRKEWLSTLEYSRHQAIKRADSDDDAEGNNNGNTISREKEAEICSPRGMNKTLEEKLLEVRKARDELNKNASKMKDFLKEHLTDELRYDELRTLLECSINTLLKVSEELSTLASKDCRDISRYASNEHEQRLRLREQLETLARQHSQLEKLTLSKGNTNEPPYIESEEDVFHDATDYPEEFQLAERKSMSSRQESMTSACDDIDRDIFNAEIVFDGNRTTMSEYQNINCDNSDSANESYLALPIRKRRDTIPDRPNQSINLWSIMRNCIGKELTKIPMPVNFNEPLSVCQRITEDLEYAYLLDRAAEKADLCEQLGYVAAYAISCYSTTGNRTTKPFNPILGETYEADRMDDLGWKSLTEQVSHHPPTVAHHATGRQWTMFQEITMTSRFRGKYLSVSPQGFTHVIFSNSGSHYTYRKVTTTVHNIIVGKLWIDNHGEMVIENHKTGDKCIVKFNAYSYFSSEKPRKVNGVIKDSKGFVKFIIQGFWDKYVDLIQVSKHEKNVLEALTPRRIWTINPPYKHSEKKYFFTKLAIELNEPDESVAPTDSRRRPDQRLMEEGKWDEANKLKNEIEEKQRQSRRQRDIEAEKAMQAGVPFPEYKAKWFEKCQDEVTGSVMHTFREEGDNYWKCKETQNWGENPDIF
ncbi:oxysterol-binding protein domain-containing protein [Ditylenchus destructor]|uniref:Oxysterol-binding protein domain-containing protein n=1 Tax=Ditylenchus destructor TaxID=166010 RepID=A0AAD4RDL9_9BILA|nr:oxysterol-binding protein domain-containing protein [Ditylenchus destructor]